MKRAEEAPSADELKERAKAKQLRRAEKEAKRARKAEKEAKKAGKRQRPEEEADAQEQPETPAATAGAADEAKPEKRARSKSPEAVAKEEAAAPSPDSVESFQMAPELKRALSDKGIKTLFPIQCKTFEMAREGGDVIGRARTGQGKTLAFVLPTLQRLLEQNRPRTAGRGPSVICLLPTRELAKQVLDDFEYFARSVRLTTVCVYGGAPFAPQENALRRGVDIVVGTPGRVKDHVERGRLKLDNLQFRVLDEADEMLNMGFQEEVEAILGSVPAADVQTLFFSATWPKWVEKIAEQNTVHQSNLLTMTSYRYF